MKSCDLETCIDKMNYAIESSSTQQILSSTDNHNSQHLTPLTQSNLGTGSITNVINNSNHNGSNEFTEASISTSADSTNSTTNSMTNSNISNNFPFDSNNNIISSCYNNSNSCSNSNSNVNYNSGETNLAVNDAPTASNEQQNIELSNCHNITSFSTSSLPPLPFLPSLSTNNTITNIKIENSLENNPTLATNSRNVNKQIPNHLHDIPSLKKSPSKNVALPQAPCQVTTFGDTNTGQKKTATNGGNTKTEDEDKNYALFVARLMQSKVSIPAQKAETDIQWHKTACEIANLHPKSTNKIGVENGKKVFMSKMKDLHKQGLYLNDLDKMYLLLKIKEIQHFYQVSAIHVVEKMTASFKNKRGNEARASTKLRRESKSMMANSDIEKNVSNIPKNNDEAVTVAGKKRNGRYDIEKTPKNGDKVHIFASVNDSVIAVAKGFVSNMEGEYCEVILDSKFKHGGSKNKNDITIYEKNSNGLIVASETSLQKAPTGLNFFYPMRKLKVLKCRPATAAPPKKRQRRNVQ